MFVNRYQVPRNNKGSQQRIAHRRHVAKGVVVASCPICRASSQFRQQAGRQQQQQLLQGEKQ